MERNIEGSLNTLTNQLEKLGENMKTLKDIQHGNYTGDNFVSRDFTQWAQELLRHHQEVSSQFHDIQPMMTSVTETLREIVKAWQREMQMTYAEMTDSPTQNIKTIISWCGKVGKQMDDIINNYLPAWKAILDGIEDSQVFSEQRQAVIDLTQKIQKMFKDFVQSTFVVTEQGKRFHIKTGTKTFPIFFVRLMALDKIQQTQESTINAYFLSEDDLNSCHHDTELDLNQIKKADRKLRSNAQSTDGSSCHFENLQFTRPFKRMQDKDQKQVHEEKYRVVFVTTINSEIYWTMSLPLVVITASNQEAHCLASIMWQCYSTDVFTLPINIPETLPWRRVADMLKTKMTRISTSHTLTDDNIEHLKNRLFGREGVSDEEGVNLTMFCWTPMAGTDEERPFSFWKWFLAIYNLIQTFLTPYWNDGLIIGFIKKEVAKRLLETNSDKVGTFILRFSDQFITPSDGVKKVFGHLTSCVRIHDSKGSKRKHASQNGTDKKDAIESFEVANCGSLKHEELANILRETWVRSKDGKNYRSFYCYHFPTNKSREELFDKYCVEDKIGINGYIITREANILCLEKHLQNVTIADTTTQDSPVASDNTGGKKQKAMTDTYPNISQRLEGGHPSAIETTSIVQQPTTEISDLFQLCSESPSSNAIPTIVQNLFPFETGPTSRSDSTMTSPTIFTESNLVTDTLLNLEEDIPLLHSEVNVYSSMAGQCDPNLGATLIDNPQGTNSVNNLSGGLSQSEYSSQSQMVMVNDVYEENYEETITENDTPITVIVENSALETPTADLPSVLSPVIIHLNGLRSYLTDEQFNTVFGWIITNISGRKETLACGEDP